MFRRLSGGLLRSEDLPEIFYVQKTFGRSSIFRTPSKDLQYVFYVQNTFRSSFKFRRPSKSLIGSGNLVNFFYVLWDLLRVRKTFRKYPNFRKTSGGLPFSEFLLFCSKSFRPFIVRSPAGGFLFSEVRQKGFYCQKFFRGPSTFRSLSRRYLGCLQNSKNFQNIVSA